MAVTHRKKWEIVRNTVRPDFDAVEVGNRTLPFGSHGAMTVHDAGEAAEIKARYQQERGEVVVIEVDSERGNPRTFAIPEMPWRAYARKTTVPTKWVGKDRRRKARTRRTEP